MISTRSVYAQTPFSALDFGDTFVQKIKNVTDAFSSAPVSISQNSNSIPNSQIQTTRVRDHVVATVSDSTSGFQGFFKKVYCSVILYIGITCVEDQPVIQTTSPVPSSAQTVASTSTSVYVPKTNTTSLPVRIIEKVISPVGQTVTTGISSAYLERRLSEIKAEIIGEVAKPYSQNLGGSRDISEKQIDSIYSDMSENIDDAIDEIDLLTQEEITELANLTSLTNSGTSTFNGYVNIADQLVLNGYAGTSGQVLISNGTSTAPTWTTLTISGADAGTLDSLDSTQFLRSDTSDSYTSGTLTFDSGTGLVVNGTTTLANLILGGDTFTDLTGTGLVVGGGVLSVSGLTTSEFSSANISQWSNDSNYLTSISGLNISDLSNDSGYLTNITGLNISELTNNSGYLTSISGLNISDLNNDLNFISDISSFTTDNLTQGSTNLYSQWSTSGSDISFVSGDVGIGTSDPQSKLQVTGTDNSLIGLFSGVTKGVRIFTDGGSGIPTIEGVDNTGNASYQQLAIGGSLLTFTTSAVERMRLTADGDLGIGTSPAARLHSISTTEQFRLGYDSSNYWSNTINSTGGLTMQGVGTGGSLTLSPTAGQNINLSLSGTGDFAVNTSQLYVDTSTGNVGIGTSTPDTLLAVAGTSLFTGASQFNSTVSIRPLGVNVANLTFYNSTYGIGTDSSDLVLFTGQGVSFKANAYNGTTYMKISNTGNVGIGTTTPSAKFAITGTAGTGDIFAIASSTEARLFTVKSTGNVGIGTATPSSKLDVYYDANNQYNFNQGYLTMTRTSSGSVTTLDSAYAGTASNGAQLHNTNAVSLGAGAFNRALLVNSSGNVGIGTTTPASILTIGSGQITTPIGSASAPSYSFSGFTNQGMYSVSTNVLGFSQGGAVRFQVFAGGVESSAQVRGAGGSAGTPTFAGANDTNTGIFFLGSDVMGLATGGTERLRIDATGNVGIGTTTPSAKFALTGTAGTSDIFAIASSTETRLFTVKSTGDVGIGTTTPTQKLSVVGNAQFTAVASGAYAFDLNLTSDGTLTTSASDQRLKENITQLDSTEILSKILLLKPTSFDWKSNSVHDIGLIAQEVELIFPELVFTNKTDGYKGINYSRLPALLISAVQEISHKLDSVLAWFAEDRFNVQGDICVDDVCVTKEQFKQLLQNGGGQSNSNPPTEDDNDNNAPPADNTDEDSGDNPIEDTEGGSDTPEPPAPDETPAPTDNGDSSPAPEPSSDSDTGDNDSSSDSSSSDSSGDSGSSEGGSDSSGGADSSI